MARALRYCERVLANGWIALSDVWDSPHIPCQGL